jgi:hypothetical protein
MDVVKMQKDMAHFLSFTLGFSILNEWKCQTICRFPSENVWECKKLKNVNGAIYSYPTILTIAKGGWSMNVVMDPIWHPLNMWMI